MAEQPALMFGPYVLESQIGLGGMGVVYKARHSATGQAVALKSVRLRSPELLAAFRREVHALSLLRHPGIVRILEHGSTGNAPWYAMELVEGRPLSEYFEQLHGARVGLATTAHSGMKLALAAAPAESEMQPPGSSTRLTLTSWRDLLPCMRALCRTLSFLHGHGLIHRDLKPENILIQRDGSPVIVDFGLVAQFGGAQGREVLEVADVGGTIAYMAPEQWTGRFVDARADLYSLGCILYECLCGFPPDSNTNGTHAWRAKAPPPPSSHNPEIGDELDAVVSRLLATDPKDRLGYADDLEDVLAQVEGVSSDLVGRRSRYLYRSDLAGRDTVLPRLVDALANARAGRSSVILLTSESGGGKTRLVMELASRAVDKEMTVVTGDCPPVTTGADHVSVLSAPLRPFRELLLAVADALHEPGVASPSRRALRDRLTVLAPYEPSLRNWAPATESEPPAPLSMEVARKRLFQSLGELIIEYSKQRALLLVLDDLQWADELSLEFLAWLAGANEATSGRFVVVATCRVEEMSESLRALTSNTNVVHEGLSRFDRIAVRQMVSGMLALADPPASLVDFAYEGSRGNPFFIAEYLRAAIEAGLLRRDGAGRWRLAFAGKSAELQERVMPPPTIASVVALRLKDLDRTCTEILGAAAVLGREFDAELVARTANCDTATVLSAYAVLSLRHILEEDGSGTSRFAHDILRESAYAAIHPELRNNLHGRAAAALEERFSERELSMRLGELGYHHAKAGSFRRSADYYERAGDRAQEAYANRDGLRFYQLALEQLEMDTIEPARLAPQRLRIRERIGDVLLVLARPAEARSMFARTLDGPAGSSSELDRARRRRKLAQTWEREHRHHDALDAYALADEELGEPHMTAARPAEWWHAYVQIQVDKAWALYFSARVPELVELVERVRPAVMQHAVPAQRARFLQAVVQAAAKRDRLRINDETLEHSLAQLEAAHECDDLRELATARFTRAFVLSMRGLDEDAEPLFVSALEDASRLDDVLLRTRFQSYYSIVHRRLGREAEARAAAESLLAFASERGMLDYVGVAHANLAWCALRAVQHDRVEAHAHEALAAWHRLRPAYVYPLEWLARMPLAARMHGVGRTEEVLTQFRCMLEDPQQLLPHELEQTIRHAITGSDATAIQTVLVDAIRFRLI